MRASAHDLHVYALFVAASALLIATSAALIVICYLGAACLILLAALPCCSRTSGAERPYRHRD